MIVLPSITIGKNPTKDIYSQPHTILIHSFRVHYVCYQIYAIIYMLLYICYYIYAIIYMLLNIHYYIYAIKYIV